MILTKKLVPGVVFVSTSGIHVYLTKASKLLAISCLSGLSLMWSHLLLLIMRQLMPLILGSGGGNHMVKMKQDGQSLSF
jgi:hypothetical protein